MTDIATIQTRITEIDTLLTRGVSSATVNGRRVEYDLAALRTERERLVGIVSGASRSQYRRVVFKSG